MDDAAEGVRARLPGRRLPRDAVPRRRACAPQVGDVLSGEPRCRAPDRDGPRARLRRLERGAARGARRGGCDGPPDGRCCGARGQDARAVALWDLDAERAHGVASELGADVAASREEALAADLLVTVTPGRKVLLAEGSLAPGQHASLMGADGPGKQEIAVEELARVRVFSDDWEQASHGGDIAHAVEAGVLERGDVTELGAVLTGAAEGRRSPAEATVFDSTGLAIQDLAIALAALERADELDLPRLHL